VIVLAGLLWLLLAGPAAAQSSSRCDSLIAAARVDTVPVSFRAALARYDGGELAPDLEERLLSGLQDAIVLPRPFTLSVFASGPTALRTLRSTGEPRGGVRPPSVIGNYRFTIGRDGRMADEAVLRTTLVPGLDSAVLAATRHAVATLPKLDAEIKLQLRLSTEDVAAGRPIIAATFPRMRVVDAVANADNPRPVFPAEEKRDSVEGEVVLRFVVGNAGTPVPNSVELVRGTTRNFVIAAAAALDTQRFQPATIGGCPVAQVVEYAFQFVLPRAPHRH
jgi:hypothetical protein